MTRTETTLIAGTYHWKLLEAKFKLSIPTSTDFRANLSITAEANHKEPFVIQAWLPTPSSAVDKFMALLSPATSIEMDKAINELIEVHFIADLIPYKNNSKLYWNITNFKEISK